MRTSVPNPDRVASRSGRAYAFCVRPGRVAIFFIICTIGILPLGCTPAPSENIALHHQEGIAHGFLVLKSLDGQVLASGDLIQVAQGTQITSETVFHFKDGSLHDETAVFTQDHSLRLVSDHLIEKGPSFPHPLEMSIDTSAGDVRIQAGENGNAKDEIKNETKNKTKTIDLPPDLANGVITMLLKNIPVSGAETRVSYLAPSAKPRLVKLSIKAIGERTFEVAGSARKATDFDIHVQIGGVAGVVAPLLGKQPPDTHVWMSVGAAPTFIKMEGPMYEGGPVWRIELAQVAVEDHNGIAQVGSKSGTEK
jgi:hypothetical protein